MSTTIAKCPHCDRMVKVDSRRYGLHAVTKTVDNQCPMSLQRTPVTGGTDADFDWRARIVADLAAQVQDRDPVVVWQYLTALPAAELQRICMVALTAIPVDQSLMDMFRWVCELPSAKAVNA